MILVKETPSFKHVEELNQGQADAPEN